MTKAFILWGTGVACVLGGAATGTALGSTEVADRATLEMYYQSHENGSAVMGRAADRKLPDHYPLVTRSGVVPVEQLADRGLFSQARYRDFDESGDDMAVAVYADSDFGPRFVDMELAPPQDSVDADAAPAQPLSPPGIANGQARLIDVQASLAMR